MRAAEGSNCDLPPVSLLTEMLSAMACWTGFGDGFGAVLGRLVLLGTAAAVAALPAVGFGLGVLDGSALKAPGLRSLKLSRPSSPTLLSLLHPVVSSASRPITQRVRRIMTVGLL